MKLSIIIPVYNERATILQILDRVFSANVDMDKEIIVVDDGSTDGTRDILRQIKNTSVKVIFHSRNKGKGAAICTARPHITSDVVLIQDADLEYDPQDYGQLLKPILDDRADAVYGSRFLGGPHRVLFFWHYVGNKFLTFLSNAFTDLNLTDMETCYKAITTPVFQRIRLTSRRFGIEPEITAELARLGCRIYEVPISYSGRDYLEGKKITWKDGVAAIYCILKFWLRRRIGNRGKGRNR